METKKLQSFLSAITRRNDVMLAGFLVMIIAMMVLPMPTWLVDTFVAFNMTVAVVLLMISVYIASPLAFSAFPAVLLLSTLFRLALSITTTRLILLQGDAGDVITTFGNFVVGGNIVVGIVVFAIITVVQFIVVTKGSERVAEVSARFSLDAMPGKQMSIDGDMRAGAIDAQEARRRRSVLAKESQLFGSMDGAMKFVKGDAIAGIFIILINIVGGISVGTLQQDMEFGGAIQVYTILTIGDGLVAQIPALFIAITSGIIVTRVSSETNENLGQEIGSQVLGQPKALLIGAAVLLGFSLIPGFPTTVFVTLGLLLCGIGLSLMVLEKRMRDNTGAFVDALAEDGQQIQSGDGPQKTSKSTMVTAPVSIEISTSLQPVLKQDILNDAFVSIKNTFEMDLGVPFPGVSLRYSTDIAANNYCINLHEVPTAQDEIRPTHLLVENAADYLSGLSVESETYVGTAPVIAAAWVPAAHKAQLINAGVVFLEPSQVLTRHLSTIMRRNVEEFVGVQETSRLIDQLKPSCADLVKEVQGALTLPVISEVLKRLVAEDISIRNLRAIFEAILKQSKHDKEPPTLAEAARAQLQRHISHKFSFMQDNKKTINVILLDAQIEEAIRGAIKPGPAGNFLSLPPDINRKLIENIRKTLGDASQKSKRPILITALDIRRYVRGLLEPYMRQLPVLSFQELTNDVSVQTVGRVSLA